MNRFLLALVLLIILLMSSCDELTYDNPFDSNTEIESDAWAPLNLTADILTDSQVQLSWQESESQIDGFRIEKKEYATAPFSQVASTDTTNYTDTGLIIGKEYTYRVCAYSGDNNKSSYVTSEIIITTFPAPYNLSTIPKIDNKIELTWADSTAYESGFIIQRKILNGTYSVLDSIEVNTYQDTTVTLGNQYVYKVSAYSQYNTSSFTDTALVKYWQDCSDIWGGTDVADNCGTCDSDSSNDCELDCAGTFGGDLVNDNCGVCGGSNTPLTGTCDCHGTPNGQADIDGCGDCVGGVTGKEACANDCLGVLGGDAVYDNCGTCDSDSSNDCTKDECGIWGGDNSTCTDNCGVINGNNAPNTGTCDCAGTPNGTAVEDECGVCDTDSSNDNSTCIDCNNEPNGTAYTGFCGNCVGGTTGSTDCYKLIFSDDFNASDQPLSQYSTYWEYDDNDFIKMNIIDNKLVIKGYSTQNIHHLWDKVLVNTKLIDKIKYSADFETSPSWLNYGYMMGLFLADWHANGVIYYFEFRTDPDGPILWWFGQLVYNSASDTWDWTTIYDLSYLNISDVDPANLKLHLNYENSKISGYFDDNNIFNYSEPEFQCQGYGISQEYDLEFEVDNVAIYGKEVASELDLGRVSRSSRVSGFPNRKIQD